MKHSSWPSCLRKTQKPWVDAFIGQGYEKSAFGAVPNYEFGERMTSRTELVASDILQNGGRGRQTWEDGVTLTAFDWNGDPASLVYDTQFEDHGFGVKDGRFDQIDFHQGFGNISERIEIDFGGLVSDVTVTLGQMSPDEQGRVETGRWTAFDGNGSQVASGRLHPELSTLGAFQKVSGSLKMFPIALESSDLFEKVVIRPTGFNDGRGEPIIEDREWLNWEETSYLPTPFEQNTDFNISGVSYERIAEYGGAASNDAPAGGDDETRSTDSGGTSSYDLVVSDRPDRSSPRDLDGANFAVGDTLYAFLDNADDGVTGVEFLLDGETIQTESLAPWDIQGGNAEASGLDTSGLDAGAHTVETRVAVDGGGGVTLRDTFTLGDETRSTDSGGTSSYDLVVSDRPDRSSPRDLDGANFAVGDTLYAFLDNADDGVTGVEFLLDGETIQTESLAPWDIQGGNAEASGLDTSGLDAGAHTVETRVAVDGGGDIVLSDAFTLVA